MNIQNKVLEGILPNLALWSYQLKQDSQLVIKTRKELEIYLITQSLKDENFKKDLVANPKAIIENEIGAKLPKELNINVFEETKDTLYMIIPSNPYEEILEVELEASFGMSYEDVAQWILEQKRNTLLDENSSIAITAKVWRDEVFKQKILTNPIAVIEQELEKKIQENIKIKVFLETATSIYIVLSKIDDKLYSPDLESNFMLNLNIPMVIGSIHPPEISTKRFIVTTQFGRICVG